MGNEKPKNGISEEVLCAEYEAVYRYALTFCGNDEEARDIVQETFLKAMKAWGSFKGDSSLYTWLCSIAKNLWLNRCKKYGREVLSDEIPDRRDIGGYSAEQQVLEKEASFRIHLLLHQMDEPYKEVFSLRVFGQLSFGEIARLFSKTESWARVTYHRARKMIGEKLRKDGAYDW